MLFRVSVSAITPFECCSLWILRVFHIPIFNKKSTRGGNDVMNVGPELHSAWFSNSSKAQKIPLSFESIMSTLTHIAPTRFAALIEASVFFRSAHLNTIKAQLQYLFTSRDFNVRQFC